MKNRYVEKLKAGFYLHKLNWHFRESFLGGWQHNLWRWQKTPKNMMAMPSSLTQPMTINEILLFPYIWYEGLMIISLFDCFPDSVDSKIFFLYQIYTSSRLHHCPCQWQALPSRLLLCFASECAYLLKNLAFVVGNKLQFRNLIGCLT